MTDANAEMWGGSVIEREVEGWRKQIWSSQKLMVNWDENGNFPFSFLSVYLSSLEGSISV